MSTSTYLASYWGELKAITSVDESIFFISEHKEQYPCAVFSIDLNARRVYDVPLPAGAVALYATKQKIWVAGNDHCLYVYNVKKKLVTKLGDAFGANISSIAVASNDRLLLTIDTELVIVHCDSAKPLQVLTLPAKATALAVDPGGEWIAVGDSSGHVSVFEAESQTDFVLSDKQMFHTGAVTALVFEENELRFFSSGTDRELFLIHARGKLDAEDKGKSYKHENPVTSMLLGPGSKRSASRLYTGGGDRVIKSWPVDSLLQPGSFKNSVGKIVDLCCCTFSEKDYLVAITTKNTIQVFELDESGKVTDKVIEYQDVYAWADSDFAQKDSDKSEQSLNRLAKLDDSKSVNLIARQIQNGKDKELQRKAAQLLSSSKNLKSPLLLKKQLKHKDEKIRGIVFDSLLISNGRDDYQLLNNSLNSGFIDIASKAIEVLVNNTKQDQQALNYLLDGLQLEPVEVRTAALSALENVASLISPKKDSEQLIQFLLVALASSHADMRKLSLIRLFQHKLLDKARVQSAVRLTLEDKSIPVRRAAFFVLLHQQVALSNELRARDEEFDRQLSDIEQVKPKSGSPKDLQDGVPEFNDEDKHPLLQAMACRQTDISILGVHGLALIHDPRALALLLQFSRDPDAAIRVEVCNAFRALKDELSIDCLADCLNDTAEAVRSAAFSALEYLLSDSLEAVLAFGFTSRYEDVHQRTIQLLVKMFALTAQQALPETINKFLVNAINDQFDSIRSEAFKTILNQQIDQDEVKTLEFLLQSSFVDIRQAVFTELMAEYKQSWAFDKIKELLNDPDAELRELALEFLLVKSKRNEFSIFEYALTTKYFDIRMESVTRLIRQPGKQTDELLLSVINDKKKSIRQAALEAIISGSSKISLEKALASIFLDIKVRAAGALARLGHSVRSTFSEMLSLEEPKEQQAKAEWLDAIVMTMKGIAELEDSSLLEQTQPFVDHKNADIRAAAVKALIAIATIENAAIINEKLLRHEDKSIRYQAALGLAYSGQEQALSILFNEKKTVYDIDRLAASVALGEQAMQYTLAHLEKGQGNIPFTTLCVLLLTDECSEKKPVSCLRIISAKRPDIRAIAAGALNSYSDPELFLEFVTRFINTYERGTSSWNIKSEDIKILALLLAYSPPKMKARVVHLLEKLRCEKQTEWEYNWQPFKVRHQAQIQQVSNSELIDKQRQSHQSLLPLVYGTYAGLAREKNSVSARYNALNKLELLLKQSSDLRSSIYPLYLQALNDLDADIRNLAFDLLLKSELSLVQTCAEALSVKQTDIGIRALQVLLETESNTAAINIIEQVILTNLDGLELKAAELLANSKDSIVVAFMALDAASISMRRKAVAMLEAEYVSNAKAGANLRAAFENRYLDVRLESALALNRKHDSFAINALFELLSSAEMEAHQGKILSALAESGRPEVVEKLLNFLISDKRGLANSKEIFRVVANFRDIKSAERLLSMSSNNTWFKQVMSALIIISGHDQEVKDPDDLNKDKQWIGKQFPRHDALLAKIVAQLFELNLFKDIERLLTAMRWSQTGQIDTMLAKCCLVTDQDFAAQAISACGWRVANRAMTAEPLQRALQRPDTQIKAAIALAQAGKNDGVAVLLNTVQHEDDYDIRCLAILALGHLADQRAVELLLDIAKDKENNLCEVACEAIGHLANSDRAYEIFEVLKGYVNDNVYHTDRALIGLRWFNTEDAWRIIRTLAATAEASYQAEAIELLAFNSTEETRNILLGIIKDADEVEIAKYAYDAAKQVFDLSDLTPEYTLLQNSAMELDCYYGVREQLDIVCDNGSAKDILLILGKCNNEIQNELELALLQRPLLELSDLTPALTSNDPAQASIAAHLIGNIDKQKISDTGIAIISKSLQEWLSRWIECRQLAQFDRSYKKKLSKLLSPCLERLCWLAGRFIISQEVLISIIEQGVNDPFAISIRIQAFKALLLFPEHVEITACATRYLTDTDPVVRTLCVEMLLNHRSKESSALLNEVLLDQSSIAMLVNSGLDSSALVNPASNAHYQGLLLPVIVNQNDVEVLVKITLDTSLDDETRLGAIEGLARVRTESAETRMVEIAGNLVDEDLCKAVWNARRRSYRARMKVEAKS